MKTQYDAGAKLLHAVMAVMVIGLLAVGLYMADLEANPFKWQLYGLHKALGLTVFAFVIIRIIWRHLNPPPLPLSTQTRFEIGLAHLVHILLYAGMIVMPISGYVMSSAGGHAVSFFGLFDVPLVVHENKELGELAKETHELAGYALMTAIALHVLGALKHHFIDRDQTFVRMFGFKA